MSPTFAVRSPPKRSFTAAARAFNHVGPGSNLSKSSKLIVHALASEPDATGEQPSR